MNNKIAVIGDRDSVMLFKALGIDVHYAEDAALVEKTIHALAHAGYAVIYITEPAAAAASEAVARYKREPFPAIILIPNSKGTTGLGMRGIKADVEKAIGADILFGEGR